MFVSLGSPSSIMLSVQESVLSVIKTSANKKAPTNAGPGGSAVVVPPAVIPSSKGAGVTPVGGRNRNSDTHRPFRPSGFGGSAGRAREDKRDGQVPPKLIASATRDSIKQWISCDDFNSVRGCSNSASSCYYAHVCCNCCESSHGYSSHSSFVSSQARAMVPFSGSNKDHHGASKSQ